MLMFDVLIHQHLRFTYAVLTSFLRTRGRPKTRVKRMDKTRFGRSGFNSAQQKQCTIITILAEFPDLSNISSFFSRLALYFRPPPSRTRSGGYFVATC